MRRSTTFATSLGNGNRRQETKTTTRILNVAEALFAENEFKAVTLRQITRRAQVDLALVNYHFGSKEKLLEAVLRRRIDFLNEERLRLLDEARIEAGGRSPSVRAILEAFIGPLIDQGAKRDPGWKNYCRLLARIIISPNHSGLMASLLRPSHIVIFQALRRALPEASETDVYFGHAFLVGALLMILSEPQYLDAFSRGAINSSNVKEGCEKLIPFVTSGFAGLANPQKQGADGSLWESSMPANSKRDSGLAKT
jgi:AcrR family transcriptional regulator